MLTDTEREAAIRAMVQRGDPDDLATDFRFLLDQLDAARAERDEAQDALGRMDEIHEALISDHVDQTAELASARKVIEAARLWKTRVWDDDFDPLGDEADGLINALAAHDAAYPPEGS